MTAQRTKPSFSENAQVVLKERYLLPGESPEGLLWRCSFNEPNYYEMMARLDFLPNSPTLFNAGTETGTLSACFKFDVPDSMDGIMDVARKAAMVLKYGGGVGYTLSALRPHGSPVRTTHKVAGGPVQFMQLYHAVAMSITQGGRRAGAQMAILHCDHPDIETFIRCKDTDAKANSLSTFNISVAATDDFMRRATAEPLSEPARLFDLMVEGAWQTGDPGCYFIDMAERRNPTPWLGKLSGTNPCFTGDTRVWTLFGPMRFDELTGQETQVLTQRDDGKLVFRRMSNIGITREQAPVYRVVTRGTGKRKRLGEFRATADHPVFLADGTQKMVGELTKGDRLSSVYRYKANSKGYLKLASTAGDEDMEHRIVAAWETDERPAYPEFHVDHIDEDKQNNHPANLRVLPHGEHNALHMRGERNPVNRFPEKNPFNRGFSGPANGMYGRQHTQETKDKISATKRAANHVVVSVEPAGYADVYDGTVDDTHRFFVLTEDDGAVLVHNCGEVPLLDNEACNLGSINLNHMWQGNSLDWDWLEETTRLATRYLDDVLDHNIFPDPAITAAVALTRKLGLGVMGLADLFCRMNIDYDSDQAFELSDQIAGVIEEVSHAESLKLGEEKGRAPAYDLMPDPLGVKDQNHYPRNTTTTCIAPTGTIAILADASSGIEPHFSHKVHRRMGSGTVLIQDWPSIAESGGFLPKTTNEIALESHVRQQGIWQKHIDLAVSKTINMPNSATREDIRRAYILAWESGCKGITVFRDGCRSYQVLTSLDDATQSPQQGNSGPDEQFKIAIQQEGSEAAESNRGAPQGHTFLTRLLAAIKPDGIKSGHEAVMVEVGQYLAAVNEMTPLELIDLTEPPPAPARRKLPDERAAITHKFRVGEQEGYLTVGLYPDGRPGEIFITSNKQGSTVAGLLDTWAISASRLLQYGIPLEEIFHKFIGLRFEPEGMTGNAAIPTAASIPDYISRWMLLKFQSPIRATQPAPRIGTGLFCPECEAPAIAVEGCLSCSANCGWERCG